MDGGLLLTLVTLLGGASVLQDAINNHGELLAEADKRELLQLVSDLKEKELSEVDKGGQSAGLARHLTKRDVAEPIRTCLRSRKKGLVMSTREYMCDDFSVLDNINWYYDWRLTLGILKEHTINCDHMATVDYVPMNFEHRADEWLGSAFYSGDDHYMLLYNEPMRYPQANMTPIHAAKAWMRQKDQAGPLTKIITPSSGGCTNQSSNCMMSDFEWFDQFFAYCTSCKFDYMAVHHYTCVPQYTLNDLRKLYDRYGLDIWLTEFACLSDDENEVKTYMKELLPELEALPYLYRYSWYKTRNTDHHGHAASLLEADSSTLTEVGQLYNLW